MSTEKPSVHSALGIDFGTSNSYFSDVKVGGVELSYTDLKFHNGRSSVPTCMLYERKKESDTQTDRDIWLPHSFGEAAIDLWKDLMDDERVDFRFRGGFKPDIAFDPEAFSDAVHFFKSIKSYLVEQRLITHFSPDSGRQVVVGVPARNVVGQERKTIEALEKAGIYDPVLIPEPEGALFYHLYYDNDRITVEKAHQGILVIDFGGGTFDVAFLQDGFVRKHWGHPMLGGRLFDDLFYQWFLSMHEGETTRKEMLDDGTLDYLRTFGFRRLKERFSSAWSNEQLTRFRERVTVGVDFDYGVFRGATLEEFLERAHSYTISPDLLHDLELLDDPSVDSLKKGSVDLLMWIQEQCARELLESLEGVDADSITATILTGGSCRWPFMRQYAQAAFPQAECFQSPDPEATISRGLALCFAFREYSKEVSQQLMEHQADLGNRIFRDIRSAYRAFAANVSERFSNELYGGQIQPIFLKWQQTGGTIAELEEQTHTAATQYFESAGQDVLERERVYLQERIEQRVNTTLFEWLRQHRITRAEYLSLEHLQKIHDEELQMGSHLSGILDGFFDTIKYVLAGILSMIVASILGGGGVALLMAGPVGWLVGLIVGGAAAWATLQNVDTQHIAIPSFILKVSASKERLDKAQNTFQKDMEQTLLDLFSDNEYTLETELEKSIQELVARLAHTVPVTAVMHSSREKSECS